MKRILIFFVTLALFTGCTSIRVKSNGAMAMTEVHEQQVPGYLLGFVTVKTLRPDQLCASGKLDSFNLMQSPQDVFLTLVTIGIYFPQTVQVLCGKP
jgi:hypothetical protein